MFGARFSGEEIGRWEGRTVWNMIKPLPFWVWNGLITGEVPAPFMTDLASVPRHAHMYDLFGGKCNREGAGHDYGYRKDSIIIIKTGKITKKVPNEVVEWAEEVRTGTFQGAPRHIWDHIFKQLMIEDGAPPELYEPMFLAVRAGGGNSYHKFTVQDNLPCDSWVGVAA